MIDNKIFVINLDKDVERWVNINKQLINCRFNYERFPAIYGKDLSQTVIDTITTNRCAKYCTRSMIGCAASHIGVWRHALELGVKYAIILEDDVSMCPEWDEKLMKYLNDDRLTFDVLLIGKHKYKGDFLSKIDKMIDVYFRGGIQSKKNNSFLNVYHRNDIDLVKYFLGAHGYVVSHNGLKKLLNEFKDGISYHIDIAMSNRDIVLMETIPELCKLNNEFDSNISQKSILLNAFPNIEVFGRPFHFTLGTSCFQINGQEILLIHLICIMLCIIGIIIVVKNCNILNIKW